MASDKRNFANFKKFPGKIIDGRYKFPVLHVEDGFGRHRIWTIQIRLIKVASKKKKYGYGWNINGDDEVPLANEYLEDEDPPAGCISQMWAEAGIIDGKITVHPPTFSRAKNQGKSDARSTFQSALIAGRAKYLKRMEKGGLPEKEFKNRSTSNTHDGMYYPMLLRKNDKEGKHITYPAKAQPKLDGTRVVGYLIKSPTKNPTLKDVRLYTRSKKIYGGFDHIRRKLLPGLIAMYDEEDDESFYVDGEFYKHGMSLQTISGMVRSEERSSAISSNGVQLHLFDGFYPSQLGNTFLRRQEDLDVMFSYIESRWIRRVKTVGVKDEEELMEKYDYFLEKGYEGAVVRDKMGKYLAHPTRNSTMLRSRYALKLKKRYSMEMPVHDFTEGIKGKDVGAILWIFKFPTKILTLQPKNITYAERYKLFKDAKKNFVKKYKGRMMTIEYEDMSKDGIPMRAKAAGFRDVD